MKIIKKNLIIITIIILIISAILLIILKRNLEINKNKIKDIKKEAPIIEEEKKEEGPKTIFVDIKGAVNKPGVYEIEETKKVIDVIGQAGGFTENADTSMINLAKNVKNEMVIIIYTKEEVANATKPNQIIKYIDKECICPKIKNDACINTDNEKNTKETTKNEEEKEETLVNINTATLEELQKLSGIGESKAEAIIAYRQEHGEFKSIEDIKEVPGIGDALYEKIKEHITV